MPHLSPTPVTAPVEPSRLRRDCRRIAVGLSVACVVISALILVDAFGPWLVRRPAGWQIAGKLITLVAPAAFMTGVWWLGRGLTLFAGSGRFGGTVGDALRGVGWALTAGGGFQILLAPSLLTLTGHGPGYVIGLDAAAIALAALGIALLMFARLFKRAARLEAELEAIL